VRIARGNTAHLLEASLAPDGTRSYRIDGKIKSGTQVKVGICVRSGLAAVLCIEPEHRNNHHACFSS